MSSRFFRTFAVKIQETMSTFYTILASIIGPIIGIAVYIIIENRRTAKKKVKKAADTMLDDISYIQEIQHLSGKTGLMVWHQYDILLAARPFFWEVMVDYAAYMESADLNNIDSLTITEEPGDSAIELAHVYNQAKGGLKNFDRLTKERASLGISGHSLTLNEKVKIVWFNQTRVIRIFTPLNDETLITKYAETLIRRTFGTEDAMKLAKPVPKEQKS